MYSFYVSRPLGAEVLAFTPIVDLTPLRPDDYKVIMNAAINAVRQWQYEPPLNGPIVFNVVLGFEPLWSRVCSRTESQATQAPTVRRPEKSLRHRTVIWGPTGRRGPFESKKRSIAR
jgi:hypothetical protein